MSWIRGLIRLLFFAIGSLYYILRCSLHAILVKDSLEGILKLRRLWFAQICWGLGIEVETRGKLPTLSGLLLCNHRSYFDPIVIMAKILAFPVGKASIKTWPIIGWGAKISGTIFVDRKSKVGRKAAREQMNETLQKGYFVINYPEGTTHTEAQTIAFKQGMFQDAAAKGFRIYPIALEYRNKVDAWVGDDTFLRHFMACFGKKKTFIRISYGTAIISDDANDLLLQTKDWINQELQVLRADWYEATEMVS